MSRNGYWRARPEAKIVYDARKCREREKNFEILTSGLSFVGIVLGTVGFCMGSFDMMFTSVAVLLLAKAVR